MFAGANCRKYWRGALALARWLALITIIAIGVFVGVSMAKNPANAFMVVFGSAFVVMMLYLISERVLP